MKIDRKKQQSSRRCASDLSILFLTRSDREPQRTPENPKKEHREREDDPQRSDREPQRTSENPKRNPEIQKTTLREATENPGKRTTIPEKHYGTC